MTLPLSLFSQQDRFTVIETNFARLLPDIPGLDQKVEMSVNGVTVTEFLRGLATNHALNINVDQNVSGIIVNNFANAKVSDVLLFMCRQYELDIKFFGTILSVYKYEPPKEKPKLVDRKPKVVYGNQTNFLSLELRSDTLDRVAEEITKTTFYNVILSPEVKKSQISVFIQNRPFENALDKMALANGLKVTKTADNFYYIEKDNATVKPNNKGDNFSFNSNTTNPNDPNLVIKKLDENVISVLAKNVPLSDILSGVSKELLINYFLYNELKGNASLYVENASYDEFLNYLFNATDYTYKIQDGVYLIGDRKQEGLRVTELIQMKYRTVEKILEHIPANLKEGIEVKEFLELNGIIVTASAPRIKELKDFIFQVDQVVPMVLCEVIIIDVKKSKMVSTGITAGLSQTPVETGGTVLPGVDMTFSSSSINNFIDGINGFGAINLGHVTPNFYVSLKAMEDAGNLKMRSTPGLSTLNSHEASMKIGKTEYYLEVSNNVVSSGVNQNILQTQNYKSVNADLSLKIKPFVSSDEQVTLEIEIQQSDFTGKISTTAPPGTVTRNFKSLIRVKDGESVMLGGLEDNMKSETTSGVPFLSRIPIIKWFFSNRTREKKADKLVVLIKTTIIY
ncbi:MAG: secretin and TonB N-terminal domain-containing protein [Flavobacteriales bacterium]